MKKITLFIAAITTIFASCSPSKERLKEKFVTSCYEAASKSATNDQMKKDFKDYCECAGEKVINKYSAKELEDFDKLEKEGKNQEMMEKLMPVIQPCLDQLQKDVMKHNSPVPTEEATPATSAPAEQPAH